MPLSRSDTVETIDLSDDYNDYNFTSSQATLPLSSQGSQVIELTDSDDDDDLQSRLPPASSSPYAAPIEISSDEEEYADRMESTSTAVDWDSDDLPSEAQVYQELRAGASSSRQPLYGTASSSFSKRRHSQSTVVDDADPDTTSSPPKKSRLYSNIRASSSPSPKPKKRTRKTSEQRALEQEQKEAKAAERERKKAEAEKTKTDKANQKLLAKQLKEIERLQKQEEKEQKQAERKANNRRADKKKAVADMTVTISNTFGQTFFEDLCEKLRDFGARVELCATPELIRGYDCVRFRRQIHRRYDTEKRAFVPVDPVYEKEESTVLLRLSIANLWALVQRNELQELVRFTRAAYDLPHRNQIFLLLVGLEELKRQDRQKWQSIEDALTYLQFDEHTFHVCVESEAEAIDRLYNIAADYAIKEEKLVERSHLPFCPNVKIKAAKGNDLYCQMLDQINRLTIAAARSIKSRYPTMRQLLDKYAQLDGNQAMQDQLLEGCPVTQRKDGTDALRGGRNLGKVMSTRVATVMVSLDPQELAVKDKS
ncbi:hypothetical protein VKT23_008937 [Stygiomarasmius scandens]|uniref:ERCC4 domain-containing protein n=1 Tax=Marasmiellus scandens TaxID=2682957 RepID=A0ABR1JIC1_9AGAR